VPNSDNRVQSDFGLGACGVFIVVLFALGSGNKNDAQRPRPTVRSPSPQISTDLAWPIQSDWLAALDIRP
jgi:hypothetical protein